MKKATLPLIVFMAPLVAPPAALAGSNFNGYPTCNA
jgi:hypothetical protein